MTPVIPHSSCPISTVPGASFSSRKNSSLRRCCVIKSFAKRTSYPQNFIVPLSASVYLFPHIRTSDLHRNPLLKVVSASGVNVAVGESDPSVADLDSSESVEESAVQSEEDTSVQTKRARTGRKSEMPPVKDEDLVPGATFTGKVRSIQPFGAFVDFGAFTEGLVHLSQLSDNFVKDVGDVVSVGEEVQVRLIEANMKTGRVSLSMRTSESTSTTDSDRKGSSRRNSQNSNQKRDRDGPGERTASKFEVGQDLEGTVKNLTKSGAFVSLPDGEEGFLPQSEEDDAEIGGIMGQTTLEVGQQVSVRVLRTSRGQATLTMKKEKNYTDFEKEVAVGIVHGKTSPFLLAFRKNKAIAAYLDVREKEREKVEALKNAEIAAQNNEGESVLASDVLSPEESVSSVDEVTKAVTETPDVIEVKSDGGSVIDEVQIETPVPEAAVPSTPPVEIEKAESDSAGQVTVTEIGSPEVVEVKSDGGSVIDEVQIETPVPEAAVPSTPPVEIEKAESDSAGQVTVTEIGSPEVVEVKSDGGSIIDEVQIETPIVEGAAVSSPPPIEIEKDEIPSPSPIDEAKGEPELDENIVISSSLENASEETPAVAAVEKQIEETPIAEAVENQIDNVGPMDAVVSSSDSNGQAGIPSPKETTVKATISPALVKQLREESGAGMMDCKRALTETEGDLVKAQEYLRKKGLASADKKASRATAEGRIGSYIHDSRIGVLIEVNCETDFVSRGDIFKELVDDLAMQVAACPQVQYLSTEDVPQAMIDKEREIEMQKEDLASKPEQIRSRIVDGRINKRLEELALLEQPYIKNDKVVVKDYVKQTIATVGENMKVKRFVRFNLGEGLEKKSQDFAAEVAAQTAVKSAPAPVADQPAAVEPKESDDKPPKPTISAALVKQLREETGAGMMDCKKALSETGGDLEKAQEFLRKKGLSTADKKSSRIAAEGRIGSYIHDSRIGVLIEVNCETDFVGRSEKFKTLVDDLAMQVVAYPKVEYVSVEDIPESIVKKEKELEMQREDILSKPENIREKIVDGRVSKRLGELALLEQPFIKDDSVLVKDLVKQSVAAIGENIKVRRFVRFTLGESVDAKTETAE